MALRRPLLVALTLGALAAGLAVGFSAGASPAQPSVATICPLSGSGTTTTLPCCGPPRAAPDDPACPPCEATPCTVPTLPSPTPTSPPHLSIPATGLRVRHGRFRVTCTQPGGTGRCTVTVRRRGHTIGRGSRTLSSGFARVTVRLRASGRAMLARTQHHRMRGRLGATASARHSSTLATLRGS